MTDRNSNPSAPKPTRKRRTRRTRDAVAHERTATVLDEPAAERVAPKRREPVGAELFHDPERDGPAPAAYQTRRRYPCPKCNRVRLESGLAAVRLNSVHGGAVAYMVCRARDCGHTWKLPVE